MQKPAISKVAVGLYILGLLFIGLGFLTSYIVFELSESRVSILLGGHGDLAWVFGHYAHVLPRFLEGAVTILLGVMAQKMSNNGWILFRGQHDA